MMWNEEKQVRLDALRAAELAGTLDEAGKAELRRYRKTRELCPRQNGGLTLEHLFHSQSSI